jgi:hypothetical protein
MDVLRGDHTGTFEANMVKTARRQHHWSLLSFGFPQCFSLRSELNFRSTWRLASEQRRNPSSPTDVRFHRTFAQRLYVLSGQTNATQRSYSARTPLRQSLQGGTHASGKVLSGVRNDPKPHESRRRSPRGKHLAASSDQAPRQKRQVVCARTAFTWRSSQAGR